MNRSQIDTLNRFKEKYEAFKEGFMGKYSQEDADKVIFDEGQLVVKLQKDDLAHYSPKK